MSQVACKECGTLIMESTYQTNDGLCMPCKKGWTAVTCSQCGKRSFRESRGLATSDLCPSCFAAREKKKPTQIEVFIQAQGKGECTLLRALFKLDERLRIENADGFIGLNLIDPPQHYADCGTELHSPRTTPSNSVAFASTGGDDVHFSLVRRGTNLGDNSPVVMTVPMGGKDVRAINVILGSNLHEFLCLGCMHGYSELEQLFYDPAETIAQLSSDPRTAGDCPNFAQSAQQNGTVPFSQEVLGSREPNDGDQKAAETLGVYRRELGLEPWKDIGTRLQELDDQFKSMLKFKRG